MVISTECQKQAVRVFVPEPWSRSTSELLQLAQEAGTTTYIAYDVLSLPSEHPQAAAVLHWDASALPKKVIDVIHTEDQFDRAHVFICSHTLNLLRRWVTPTSGVDSSACRGLQQELCAANRVLCAQERSRWKQQLACLLCCSPGVQRGPHGEMSSMTARLLQRLLLWGKWGDKDRHAQCGLSLHRAVLATLLSHMLAWVITTTVPHYFPMDSSNAENFFDNARVGLDWLCQQPGGFKVHVDWAQNLAVLGHAAIHASQQLAALALSVAPQIQLLLVWSARVFGIHVALGIAADLLLLLSLPAAILHRVTWALQAVQLATVRMMWDLVRGHRDARRELRSAFRAVMSQMRTWMGVRQVAHKDEGHQTLSHAPTDVLIEQLLVGMLFLAPLLATLPTTWLLHAVTALIHLVLLLSRCIIHSAAAVLEMGSVYEIILWLGQAWWGSVDLGGDLDVMCIGSNTASVVGLSGTSVRKSCQVVYFRVGTAFTPLTTALQPAIEHVATEMSLLKHALM